ncbi:MAG: WYL domain-containing protein [Clostridia bacterium]|nr:WYL domain-containing protein [Clostridia bacterium]
MIFSELYSAYYNAVAALLKEVIAGNREEKHLRETVERHAFAESALTVLPALKQQKWQLLTKEGDTPLRHAPTLPLTLLERRWLKAVSMDPRVRLFDLSFEGLEDVEPLFTPDDYVIYDRYADGDPYEDEGYVSRFRLILRAIREHRPLRIETVNRRGRPIVMNLMPLRLEYSEKDDKFRLISSGCRYGKTVNLGRILSCRFYEGTNYSEHHESPRTLRSLTLRIRDERNALERCMLHFAHFEKRAERLEGNEYALHLRYDGEDETELVIRVLSFGPMVEVLEPQEFRALIAERLIRQNKLRM